MVDGRFRREGLEEKALEHIPRGLKIQGVKQVEARLEQDGGRSRALLPACGFRLMEEPRAMYAALKHRIGGNSTVKKIAFALCLGLGCLVLAGCSGSSEPFEAKTYTPEGQVQGVRLDVKDREVEVALSPDGQVHIQYRENSKEFYEIALSDEKVVTMTSAANKEWTDYIGVSASGEDRKITVQVPDGLLDSLEISTTNEDITLPELAVTGSVSLSSNGGSVRLHVKNGDISGTVAGSYDDYSIQCSVKKGESTLPDSKTGGEKTLEAACNNGNVEISFAGE